MHPDHVLPPDVPKTNVVISKQAAMTRKSEKLRTVIWPSWQESYFVAPVSKLDKENGDRKVDTCQRAANNKSGFSPPPDVAKRLHLCDVSSLVDFWQRTQHSGRFELNA